MTSFASRISHALELLKAKCTCGELHTADPSLRVPVHCTCGKTLTPKRIGLSLVLVERASA